MNKTIIYVPLAYEPGMNTGINLSTGGGNVLNIYLMNVCVALISARKSNPTSEVALVTNLDANEIPEEFTAIFGKENISVIHIPFDCFRFPRDYRWALAFYKLCALRGIVQRGYDALCYFDADVYIQGCFDPIWKECRQNILLYNINHGLNVENYVTFCDEVEGFLAEKRLITHYGGEFFAADANNARIFSEEAFQIYRKMQEKEFVTTKGDEFIVCLAADRLKEIIKNAGGYVYRFWTGVQFRLVSTCYRFNKVIVLHLPGEKERGILKIYRYYVRRGELPTENKVWKICHMTRPSVSEQIKCLLLRVNKAVRAQNYCFAGHLAKGSKNQ